MIQREHPFLWASAMQAMMRRSSFRNNVAFLLVMAAFGSISAGDDTMPSTREAGSAKPPLGVTEMENRAIEAAEGAPQPNSSCTLTSGVYVLSVMILFLH